MLELIISQIFNIIFSPIKLIVKLLFINNI